LGFLHQKVELLRLAVLMFLHQDSSEEQEQQIHSHLESSMQLYKEKYNYENENEIKCARSLTINKFSQPQLSDNTLEQYYRGPALLR